MCPALDPAPDPRRPSLVGGATPTQFGELVDKSPSTIHRYIRDGRIPAVKVGGTYRIPVDAAIAAIVKPV